MTGKDIVRALVEDADLDREVEVLDTRTGNRLMIKECIYDGKYRRMIVKVESEPDEVGT